MVGRVIEVTFMLVLVFLILSNAMGFAISVGALSGSYSQAVKTLQGR